MEKLSKQGKSLKNFTYTNKEIADEIYSAINSTQFLGVSVRDSARTRNKTKALSLIRGRLIFNRFCICYRDTLRLVRKVTESH